jgi:hypothetical protein
VALMDNYLGLITSQHRDKTKYIKTVTALLTHSDAVFECANYLNDSYDINLAGGKQEDVLGQIVGQNRTLDFQPDKGLSPVLDNEAYREALVAQIAKNFWKGGIEDLKNTWELLFGTGIVIQDNQDMTMSVLVIGNFLDITKQMILMGYIIPKPQSVGINFYFSEDAVFGYDLENNVIKGYDHANWAKSTTDNSFAYDRDSDSEKLLGFDKGNWT